VVELAKSYDYESYAGGCLLLVGSPMPDRSKVMTQTKRDALALQVLGTVKGRNSLWRQSYLRD